MLIVQALAGDCAKRSKRMNGWKLDIPDLDRKVLPNKPPIYPANVKIENQQKILHLSDVHLQLDYKVEQFMNLLQSIMIVFNVICLAQF